MDTTRQKSRSRSRQTTYSWPAQIKYSNHSNHTGPIVEAGAGSSSYDSFFEQISSGYGRGSFNYCLHHVKRVSGYSGFSQGAHIVQTSGTPPLDCVFPRTGSQRFSGAAHLLGVTAAKTALGATLLSESWDSWATKGLTKLQPDLTEISMPNFFYELKDLRKSILVKATKGVYTKGYNAALRLKHLTRNLKRHSSATLPAELVLELEFAAKPLISDLKLIWASMVSTKSKIDAWTASVGARKAKNGRITAKTDIVSGTTTLPQIGTGHSVAWTARREMTMDAYMRYRPLPLQNLRMLQGPLAFLDRYGVQLDAQAVWNAIPFSFLIDYVLNINEVLSNWHIDACELPIQLEDFCLQYKYSTKITTVHSASFTLFGQAIVEKAAPWEDNESVFRRLPCKPSESGLISLGWKSPNMKKWWLSFNLATVLAAGGTPPKRS